jgi:hypothetical protein
MFRDGAKTAENKSLVEPRRKYSQIGRRPKKRSEKRSQRREKMSSDKDFELKYAYLQELREMEFEAKEREAVKEAIRSAAQRRAVKDRIIQEKQAKDDENSRWEIYMVSSHAAIEGRIRARARSDRRMVQEQEATQEPVSVQRRRATQEPVSDADAGTDREADAGTDREADAGTDRDAGAGTDREEDAGTDPRKGCAGIRRGGCADMKKNVTTCRGAMSFAGAFGGAQALALAGVMAGVVIGAVEIGLMCADQAEEAIGRAEKVAYAAAVAGEEIIALAGAVAGIEVIKVARAVVGAVTTGAVTTGAVTTGAVATGETMMETKMETNTEADEGSSSPSRAADGAVAGQATATRASDSQGQRADSEDADTATSAKEGTNAASMASEDEESSEDEDAGPCAGAASMASAVGDAEGIAGATSMASVVEVAGMQASAEYDAWQGTGAVEDAAMQCVADEITWKTGARGASKCAVDEEVTGMHPGVDHTSKCASAAKDTCPCDSIVYKTDVIALHENVMSEEEDEGENWKLQCEDGGLVTEIQPEDEEECMPDQVEDSDEENEDGGTEEAVGSNLLKVILMCIEEERRGLYGSKGGGVGQKVQLTWGLEPMRERGKTKWLVRHSGDIVFAGQLHIQEHSDAQ